MRVLHIELGFPEQLEDLGGDPVLYALCVCLLGVLVLHEVSWIRFRLRDAICIVLPGSCVRP